MSLQERIDRWASQALAKLLRGLLTRAMGGAPASQAPVSHSRVARSAIALHRDPWCGTHVSPEVSFPLEDAGRVLHFCSAECRARYQRSTRHAASA